MNQFRRHAPVIIIIIMTVAKVQKAELRTQCHGLSLMDLHAFGNRQGRRRPEIHVRKRSAAAGYARAGLGLQVCFIGWPVADFHWLSIGV